MALTNNTLSTIAPILVKEGLQALRENSIAVRFAQFDISDKLAQKGATINVTVPSVVPAQDVDVSSSANTATALTPTVVPVTLTQWKEAVFAMSDKDIFDIQEGYLPNQATEAIKSLANAVDAFVLGKYVDFYGAVGTAGTTPSSVSDITGCKRVLNTQLAPVSNRVLLLDEYAEEKFLQLDTFIEVDKVGDTMALREGSLGRKFGFNIFMDQNMPTHTKGTLAAQNDIAAKAIYAVGTKSITLDDSAGGTLTGTLVKGDIITFAGDSQTYVVTADATAATNEIAISIEPGLKVATADGTVVTLTDSHTVNLAMHTQAIAFASRPLETIDGLGNVIETAIDDISGLTLRLEISRENKQTRWSFDILYGGATIRREFGCRLLG